VSAFTKRRSRQREGEELREKEEKHRRVKA